jgi:tRNA wybutosine-synthesizing protein 3
MTASLQHARPVLSAASSAGFRESGLQSLRCLDYEGNHPKSQTRVDVGFPIVAVRSSGLALESIIGYCEANEEISHIGESGDDHENLIIRSLVTEEYLTLLVNIANERFEENRRRVERFRTNLLQSLVSVIPKSSTLKQAEVNRNPRKGDWEDPIARRERKRAEGLLRQSVISQRRETDDQVKIDNEESQMSVVAELEDPYRLEDDEASSSVPRRSK